MYSIILAGGKGTRLWPLSRKNFPKQFLSLFDNRSFIQITALRLSKISQVNNIFVIAGNEYYFTIKNHLSKIFNKEFENIILEPEGRNTAPAIALAVKYLIEKKNAKSDEVVFFSPSDHIIEQEDDLLNSINNIISTDLIKNYIFTFGILPDKPETGYGYIQIGNELSNNIFNVIKFVEKPTLEKAKEYLNSKNYLWNSGMFLFSINVIIESFKKYFPELYDMMMKMNYDVFIKNYNMIKNISIDYAVMEKADNILCQLLKIKWSDVGSWESLYKLWKKDKNKNVVIGNVEYIDVKNSFILSSNKLTALIGVKNLAVIETDDAILISDRNKYQQVKDIVEVLTKKNKKEVFEHKTIYRPWGSYTVLEESDRYKIKKIVVNQGESLSLQRHQHRSEHWIVVKGTALVEIGDKKLYIHENESAYVPKSVVHRLSNPGKIPLEIIEVQNGEYIEEDDIERLEDIYGRE